MRSGACKCDTRGRELHTCALRQPRGTGRERPAEPGAPRHPPADRRAPPAPPAPQNSAKDVVTVRGGNGHRPDSEVGRGAMSSDSLLLRHYDVFPYLIETGYIRDFIL